MILPVRSRFIALAEYDAKSMVLSVHMKSGVTVRHVGVPPQMFTAFVADRSPGHYYNQKIKDVFPQATRLRGRAKPAPAPVAARWPSLAAYQAALQNPATALSLDELRGAVPAAGPWGLPHLVAGRYAAVVRMSGPRGVWALRVFTSPPVDEAQRYPALEAFVRAHPLPFLVRAEYRPQGITVAGQAYPVVLMPWVEGTTLEQWLDADPGRAASLVAAWRRLTGALAAAGMAHGDLQAGNIMVGPGGLVLVDYDSVEVPQGPTQRRIAGHPDYVPHSLGPGPGRVADRAAGLVIEASLLALGREPALWARYHDTENLIFTRRDLEDTKTPLWKDLGTLGDRELDLVLEQLREALVKPVSPGPRPWQGVSLLEWSASLPARDPTPAARGAEEEAEEDDPLEAELEAQLEAELGESEPSVPEAFQLFGEMVASGHVTAALAALIQWLDVNDAAVEAALGRREAARLRRRAHRLLADLGGVAGEDGEDPGEAP